MSDDPQWPRAAGWLASGGNPTGVRLAVCGVPLSTTSISASGAHTTPRAVRTALRRFPTFHAGLGVDLEQIAVTDHGDLELADTAVGDAVDSVEMQLIHATAVPRPALTVLIGGDNAITRPAMRALLDLPTAGLLTLDAHHDVRGFHAGPTNGTPVRGLLEDGLRGTAVVQIGIGHLTNSRAYRTYCEEHGITLISADDARGSVGAVVRRELDRLAGTCSEIYVDLDVDVLDAAFAPGIPGARPGGFAPHELLEAAVEAGRHIRVRAIDITEVDATADVDGRAVDVAAMCLLSAAAGLAARAPGHGDR